MTESVLAQQLQQHGIDTISELQAHIKQASGRDVGKASLSRFLNGVGGISSRNLVALQQAFPEVAQASWAELVQLPQADLQNTEH